MSSVSVRPYISGDAAAIEAVVASGLATLRQISTVLAIVSAHPSVLVVVVIAVVARRWVPDPIDYLRHARRISSLRSQNDVNPANATARTQLAEIWLAKRRPRRAIPHLEHALQRDPESAELK